MSQINPMNVPLRLYTKIDQYHKVVELLRAKIRYCFYKPLFILDLAIGTAHATSMMHQYTLKQPQISETSRRKSK